MDGAWKKDVRKDCPTTGIGWVVKIGQEVAFRGNDMIKANEALQCEGLAVLLGMEEAYQRRIGSIKIFNDSFVLVQTLVKNLVPFQLVSICHDIL